MRLADRMGRIGNESAFEVLARARALEAKGRDVVHLEIGEPDFDTPENIVEAGCQALRDGYTHYGPSCGLPDLRQAIADEISCTRLIPVDPEQVIVTTGAKPVMFYSILALVDHGDEVIYPSPSFPIYESMIKFSGGVPVPVALTEETGFAFDLDQLRASVSDKTKMIIINSPGNPTGGVLETDELRVIADIARERDIIVLSDEIYSRIVYQGRFESITQFEGLPERTIILDGFSKTYAMTGWRLGFGIFPKWLVPHINRLIVNSVSCTSPFVQVAGVEALQGPQDQVEEMVGEFQDRRDFIVDGLNRISGITCISPQGAFYAFPNIKKLGVKSKPFADFLLDEHGVATLSGSSFGEYGEGYIRLSYANSIENIGRALERLDAAASDVRTGKVRL
jgi:aspartate aminotransferase